MTKWKTSLHLNYSEGSIICENLGINSGIFQSNSLPPLLFCLALTPLLHELIETGYGYKIGEEKINHLFYIDDLKLYGKNDKELDGLLCTVKKFSEDIGMEFGLDKCAKATFIRGRLTSTSEIKLNEDISIRELDQEETYKYLGIDEGNGMQHAKMKEIIRKECYRRIRAIIHNKLNAKNKLEAINTLATPAVTYSFNVINWNLEEIKRMDRKIQKLLTLNRMHHPKVDANRMYVPRKEAGRGMINLEMCFETTTIGLNTYLLSSDARMLKLVLQHEKKKKKLRSVMKESRKFKFQLNMAHEENEQTTEATKAAKEIKKKVKQGYLDDMKKT